MSGLREYSLPVIIALLIHGVVLLALSMSYDKKPKLSEVVPPKFVVAKTVKLKPEATKPAKVAQAKPADTAKKQEQQKQQQLERQRQQKLEQQRQERAKQEKLKAEKAAQEKKRLALEQERAEKQRKEQERKRQEQQKRLEGEKQKKAREDALAQAFKEEQLFAQLQDDMAQEQLQVESEQEAQSYIAVIQQAVIANWSRPASARNGMEVILAVQLVPNGTVIDVKVEKSSGNDAFDRSAVAAVKKAERFPELAQMKSTTFERYFRHFSMRFNPDDLRL